MRPSHVRRRVDSNHAELVQQLRKLGVWCWSTAAMGSGFPDLLCFARGRFVLLEVKDGAKVASAQTLTPAEKAFHAACPGPLHVVRTLEEALKALGLQRTHPPDCDDPYCCPEGGRR